LNYKTIDDSGIGRALQSFSDTIHLTLDALNGKNWEKGDQDMGVIQELSSAVLVRFRTFIQKSFFSSDYVEIEEPLSSAKPDLIWSENTRTLNLLQLLSHESSLRKRHRTSQSNVIEEYSTKRSKLLERDPRFVSPYNINTNQTSSQIGV
jgi:hypothetical protein